MLSATIFNDIIYLFLLQIIGFISSILLQRMNTTAKDQLFFLKSFNLFMFIMPIIFVISDYQSWQLVTIPVAIGQVVQPSIAPRVPILNYDYDYKDLIIAIYSMITGLILGKIILSIIALNIKLKGSQKNHAHTLTYYLQNKIMSSAFSFGFLKPKIFLSKRLIDNSSDIELNLILMHEKHHCDYRDPLWNLLSLINRSLLFFSPFSYFLHKKLELELEVFCDESTIEKSKASSITYGETLLKTIRYELTKHSYLNYMGNSALKQRMYRMKSRMIHRPWLKGFVLAFCLLAGLTTIAATSSQITKRPLYKVSSQVFIDGKSVANPIIVLKENKVGVIELKNELNQVTTITISASRGKMPIEGTPGIYIDYHIANKKGGLNQKAKIAVIEGNEAITEFGYFDSKPKYKIKLKATRI
jgi:beta-lactamase regulating signal transducer with metallopeptidase domain